MNHFSERRLIARYPDNVSSGSSWPRMQTHSSTLRAQEPLVWEERKFVALSHADLQGVARDLAAIRQRIMELDLELTCVPSRGKDPNASQDIRAERKDYVKEEAVLINKYRHLLSILRLYGAE